jgi:hypothetical protein
MIGASAPRENEGRISRARETFNPVLAARLFRGAARRLESVVPVFRRGI